MPQTISLWDGAAIKSATTCSQSTAIASVPLPSVLIAAQRLAWCATKSDTIHALASLSQDGLKTGVAMKTKVINGSSCLPNRALSARRLSRKMADAFTWNARTTSVCMSFATTVCLASVWTTLLTSASAQSSIKLKTTKSFRMRKQSERKV